MGHKIADKPNVVDPLYWGDGGFAKDIHLYLLDLIHKGQESEVFFDRYELKNYDRFSISSFAWFGKDLNGFAERVGRSLPGYDKSDHRLYRNEERWLAEDYPKHLERINCICGDALCVHYAFFKQRHILEDNPIVFQRYRELADRKYHDSYYELLKYE